MEYIQLDTMEVILDRQGKMEEVVALHAIGKLAQAVTTWCWKEKFYLISRWIFCIRKTWFTKT